MMPRANEEAVLSRYYGTDAKEAWAGGRGKSRMLQEVYACWENPDRVFDGGDDTTFRVLVPLSAGLDSLTAFAMAVYAGLRPVPVYVATGAEYTDVEHRTAQKLAAWLTGDESVERIDVDVTYRKWAHVDAARNLVITFALAERFAPSQTMPYHHDQRRSWAELWFGNTAEWQETPICGGDKCARFFADAQALLYERGHDLRIVNPVGALTKADCVAYLAGHGLLDVALASRSCYDGESEHGCGRCRSCFRRWIAFSLAGYRDEVEDTFDTLDFAAHVESFMAARAARFDVTMSEQRTELVAGLLLDRGWIKEDAL